MRLVLIPILMIAGTLTGRAEEDAEAAESPPRRMQLVTVGERPPYRQEIRDGVRYELPAPPGSLPPNELEIGIPSEDEEEEQVGSLKLRLGTITSPIVVPGGKGPLSLRTAGGGEGGRPWCRIERPERGDFIVVLWRDPRAGTWDRPVALVVPAKFPKGHATFVNVASGPVALVYGFEKLALNSGKVLMRELKPGEPQGIQVGLPREDRLQRIISRSVEQLAGQHSLVVFFRADGLKPRGPLGVKVIRMEASDVPGTPGKGRNTSSSE